jgi:hypothetical protein
MEIIFAFLIFLILTSLVAFSIWGTLYITYLVIGYFIVIIKGVKQDKRLSEAVNGDLDDRTKDLLAFVLSGLIVWITIQIGGWTPVEIGLYLGAAIFYLQIWVQTGGTFSIPFKRSRASNLKDDTYDLVDLGKPLGEMSPDERKKASEKIADAMLKKVTDAYKKK